MENTTSLKQAQYFGAIFDGEGDNNSDVWDSLWVTTPPFEKLDILLVAFAHTVVDPTTGKYVLGFWDQNPVIPDGATRLKTVVSTARAVNPNIKILISLGYGSADLGNACQNIDIFSASVVAFIKKFNLDGFDIDYEEFTGLNQNNVDQIFQSLGTALHTTGYLFSMSPAFGTQCMNATNMENFDFVFPQTYGGTSISEIQGLGVPDSKIFNACHTEGAGTIENENNLCDQSVKNAAGLGGVFNWRMDANYNKQTQNWDWNWNAITELYNQMHPEK